MEFGFEKTFPQLDQVPEETAETFREMLQCYIQAKAKKSKLPRLERRSNVSEVVDDKGEICCLFKTYTHEKYHMLEPAVFLLDQGLSGVPPTIFICTKEETGCLVKFVENASAVDGIASGLKTLPEEIQKLCITHIRFGSTDAHDGNTLARRDEKGIHRLIPIDHEESFNNGFKLGELWWVDLKEAKVAFSSEMVKKVRQLDVDRDIEFLKKCGWEVTATFMKHFKIFTHFLKKAVEFQLTPNEIAVLALGSFKRYPNLNLQDIVKTSDRKNGDEVFIKSAKEKIEEGLKEFVLKVHKRQVGKKPKR